MRRCSVKKLILLLLCLIFVLSSCGEAESSDKIKIVATMFPQYDFAREIAGDHANVELLLDFGADSHSYEPTPADIIKISKADLFIYTGNEMELWAAKLLESTDIKKSIESGSLTVLDLSAHTDLLPMHEHGHEEFDTHIWTSPENAKKMCDAIANSLIEIDSENSVTYKSSLESYKVELDKISENAADIAKNAAQSKAFFGGSFAFRYLFDYMGISHASIYEGCSSHAEPSAKDISDMIKQIKASGAKYVLFDTASEERIAKTIADECGIEVLHLHAIHNITKAEFEAGENYLSLMQKNIETLRKALS